MKQLFFLGLIIWLSLSSSTMSGWEEWMPSPPSPNVEAHRAWSEWLVECEDSVLEQYLTLDSRRAEPNEFTSKIGLCWAEARKPNRMRVPSGHNH